jgi:translocation and assembly module TamB
MENGRFASAATGADIRDLDLRGRFDERRLVIEALSADTEGGGRIGGQGEIGFGGALDLRLETRDALLFARPDARARVTGPVRIRSEGEGGTISGELRLSGARLRFGRGEAGGGGASSGGGGGGWRLALSLAAERVEVEGRGLDSRWNAELRVGGTTGAPAFTGEATLIEGSYRLLGSAFELSRGTMRFDGSADPRLDIVARAAGGSGPAVRITGRASRPEIGFDVPPASERRVPALPAPGPREAALAAGRRRRTGWRRGAGRRASAQLE